MKYVYATRDEAKIETAKQKLAERAQLLDGARIVGFRVHTDGHERLSSDVKHWIVEGYTTQAEIDEAGA